MAKKDGKTAGPTRNGGMSKIDAVRKALAELGDDAMPLRIQQFVKQRFNLDMTVNHVSNCKSEITRQAAKGQPDAPKQPSTAPTPTAAAPTETKGGTQPAHPEPATATSPTAKKNDAPADRAPAAPPGSVTKIEAVRRALAARGKNATASQLRPWIREKFNLDLSNEHITKYKGKILHESKGGSKPVASKPAAPKAAAPKPPPAPKATEPAATPRSGQATSATGGIRFEDVQATQELVGRIGADQLRALIALFGK